MLDRCGGKTQFKKKKKLIIFFNFDFISLSRQTNKTGGGWGAAYK